MPSTCSYPSLSPGPYSTTLARNWAQLNPSSWKKQLLVEVFKDALLYALIPHDLSFSLILNGHLFMDISWHDDGHILVFERNKAVFPQQIFLQEQPTPWATCQGPYPDTRHPSLVSGTASQAGNNPSLLGVTLQDDTAIGAWLESTATCRQELRTAWLLLFSGERNFPAMSAHSLWWLWDVAGVRTTIVAELLW